MSDPSELLAAAMAKSTDRQALEYGGADWRTTAVDVLAEGWRPPPRVITDPAEMDAMGNRAVVRDDTGLTFAHESGSWCVAGPIRGTHSSAEVLDISDGKVTVLWEPADA
jgi:hypothetical protein